MASGALKKITTRAKQIYKHGGTWKAAIKKAGAEYRGAKKSKPKRRRVSGTLSQGARPSSFAVGRVKKKHARHRVGATLSDGARPSSYAVGGLSAAHHIGKAKQKIGHEIASAELKKFQAKKKSIKNKIAKRITALKSKYRKLC
jgi:hypothetical protein